jgi:hypothetical protein
LSPRPNHHIQVGANTNKYIIIVDCDVTDTGPAHQSKVPEPIDRPAMMSFRTRDSRVLALSDVYKFSPPPPLTFPSFLPHSLCSLVLSLVCFSRLRRISDPNTKGSRTGMSQFLICTASTFGCRCVLPFGLPIFSSVVSSFDDALEKIPSG